MRHTLLFILVLLCPLLGFAQVDTLEIESQVKAVTVYPEGAQITREISQSLPLGKSVIVFKGLPYDINQDNLQLGCSKLDHILSLKLEKEQGKPIGKPKEMIELEAQLDPIQLEFKELSKQYNLLNTEKEILSQNSKLNTSSTTVPIEELKKTMAYFKQSMNKIESSKLKIELRKEELTKQLKEISNKLHEIANKDYKNTSKLIVTINNKDAQKIDYTLSYFHFDAGWVPNYNFRVDNIGQPLTADYNATIYQFTGEDWKDVDLTLATVAPTINKSEVRLETWILEQAVKKKTPKPKPITYTSLVEDEELKDIEGNSISIRGSITDGASGETIPLVNVVVKSGQNVVQGVSADFDGKYIISPIDPGTYNIEFSFVGYTTNIIKNVVVYKNKPNILNVELLEDNSLLEEVILSYQSPIIDPYKSGTTIYMGGLPAATSVSKPKSPIQSIVDNIMDDLKDDFSYPEFKIEAPFTILNDSKETDVRIKSIKIPTTYQYHIIPKVQQFAFLEAGIPNWNSYDFLSGNAKIYLKGKFIGQTFLNTDNFSDTLQLQLGKDADIQVKRTYEKALGGKITSGNKVKETIAYSILVKNNKQVPVNLVVEDQIPITRRKDISIELLEQGEAKLNSQIGQLLWDINLTPGETKNIQFSYLAKYPKF